MITADLPVQLALAAVALISNGLSAFAGGGAGLVQLPALILLGLNFSTALATHKVASVALGVGAAGRHMRASSLDRRLSALVLCAGLPGVCIGANLVLAIPDQVATIGLAVLTLGLGLYSSRRPQLGNDEHLKVVTGKTLWVGAFGLFTIGIINGSLTSGTGLFVTLWLVRWFGLSYIRAVAHTLILVGLAWNGTGALALGLKGDIHWQWLPALIVGSLVGGYIGAHWSIKKGETIVKQAFEILALVMGLSLLVRGLLL